MPDAEEIDCMMRKLGHEGKAPGFLGGHVQGLLGAVATRQAWGI